MVDSLIEHDSHVASLIATLLNDPTTIERALWIAQSRHQKKKAPLARGFLWLL
jgi:hypothetical protein